MNEFDKVDPQIQEKIVASTVGTPSPSTAPYPAAAEKGAKHTRRVFLFTLALGLNAIVGAVLAVPIFGYIYDVRSGKLIEVPEATAAGKTAV